MSFLDKQKALLSSKQDPKKESWNEFRTTIKSAEADIRKFHRKTPEMESLFNSVAGLKVCNFINWTCEICEIFKNTLSYITFEVTASESGLTYQAILNVSHKIAPYEIAPTQFTTTWNKFFKVSIMIINQRFVAITKTFAFYSE